MTKQKEPDPRWTITECSYVPDDRLWRGMATRDGVSRPFLLYDGDYQPQDCKIGCKIQMKEKAV